MSSTDIVTWESSYALPTQCPVLTSSRGYHPTHTLRCPGHILALCHARDSPESNTGNRVPGPICTGVSGFFLYQGCGFLLLISAGADLGCCTAGAEERSAM
eukprot:3941320-Rhodomonas_salina.1